MRNYTLEALQWEEEEHFDEEDTQALIECVCVATSENEEFC